MNGQDTKDGLQLHFCTSLFQVPQSQQRATTNQTNFVPIASQNPAPAAVAQAAPPPPAPRIAVNG